MELSAEALRVLHPREVYSKFARAGVRPDGRTPQTSRKTAISSSTLACDGSCIVRLGGTTVAAGVHVVLAPSLPRGAAASPITVAVQIPAACSSRFRRSHLGDPGAARAASLTSMLVALLRNPAVLGSTELMIDASYSFHLEVDAICTTFDGNIEDACILAVACAVAATTLPEVCQRPDGSWAPAAEAAAAVGGAAPAPAAARQPARPVRLGAVPVPLTFSCIRLADAGGSSAAAPTAAGAAGVVIADPTAEEEDLAHGTITVVAALPTAVTAAAAGQQCGKKGGVPVGEALLVRQGGGPVAMATVSECLVLARAHAAASSALLAPPPG